MGLGTASNTWFGANATVPGNLDFDLGDEFQVNQIAMWSYTGGNLAALDGFDVYVDDNAGFTSPVLAGSYTFSNPGGSPGAFVFDVTDTTGQFVRLRLTTTNHTLLGMGEIVFGGVSVPEPASCGLLLLGVAGFATRRRRRPRV